MSTDENIPVPTEDPDDGDGNIQEDFSPPPSNERLLVRAKETGIYFGLFDITISNFFVLDLGIFV